MCLIVHTIDFFLTTDDNIKAHKDTNWNFYSSFFV